MTVDELIEILEKMPQSATVQLGVPPPGDAYYTLTRVDYWDKDNSVTLEGGDE